MSFTQPTLAWLLAISLQLLPCHGGTFWHVSDLHLDYAYVAGGNLSNWCHSNRDTPLDPSNDVVGPAGNYGCDSPYILVMSSLEAMHKFQPKPDFIVWTGDSAPHWREPSPPDQNYIMNVTSAVFTRLDQLFPGIPIVPALGNHDSTPPDQFPISTTEQKTPEYYIDLWKNGDFGKHIEAEGKESFQSCGYYSKVLYNRLRFVVLNTNIYYGDNYTKGEDPCGQLDWLNDTLQAANETVFIVAHVPPGAFERGGKLGFNINFNRPAENYHEINNRFVQIVSEERNAAKISGHLYGHLHTDTFRIFLDRARSADPRGVGFMAGSVTPVVWAKDGDPGTGVVGVNPSIRLFTYRDSDYRLMDYEEYSLDILEADIEEPSAGLPGIQGDGSADNRRGDQDQGSDRRKKRGVEDNTSQMSPAVPAVPGLPTVASIPAIPGLPTVDSIPAIPGLPTVVSVPAITVLPAVPLSNDTSMLSLNLPPFPDPLNATSEGATLAGDNSTSNDTNSAPANNDMEISPTNNDTAHAPANNDTVPAPANNDPLTVPVSSKAINDLTSRWQKLYVATEAYKVPDLTAASMFEAVQRMVREGPGGEVFQEYYRHNTAGHQRHQCKEECWGQHLCCITKLVEKELINCLQDTNSSNRFYYDVNGTLRAPPNDNDNLTKPPQTAGSTPQVEIEVVTGATNSKDVEKERIESTSYITSNAVSIFFGILGLLVLVTIGLLGYKKYKDSRYRNQEFLLTDSVFRYDGYSQLDDD